jgi:hypothetical protein
MAQRFLIQALVAVAVFLLPSDGVSAKDACAPLLIDGEKLKFEIRYGSIPAGHAWLEVENRATGDGDVYRITSTARSNDIVSLFFEVHDVVVSEVDASTFEPRHFEKRLREGRLRKQEIVTYEGGGIAVSEGQTFQLAPGTRDILSALYYIRGRELRVGDEIPVRTFENGRCYDARVKVLRKEMISTRHGDLRCLVIEPVIDQGIFARTGRLLIWLTDDSLKLPVLVKSKVKIGSFVARLVGLDYKGGRS